MNVTATVNGTPVDLALDPSGYRGVVELDGFRHVVHCTVTACGPAAVSPVKARWSIEPEGQL
jgi:hypothetical protein